MAEKIVQVANINQDTYAVTGSWITMSSPGAELSIEKASADNTIFGVGSFESSLPTIASHTVSMSSYIRETAGYKADLKRGGTPVAFTDEDMSLVSGTTYAIDDASKNFFDPRTPVVVEDGGSVVDPEDYTLDHLFGRVTFNSSPVGLVTVSGASVPTTVFASANTIDMGQTANTTDITTFRTAQEDNGWTRHQYSLQNASAELSGFYNASDDFFTILNNNEEILMEVDWAGNGDFVSRGVFRVESISGSGDVGAPEEASVSMVLSVIEGVLPYSFEIDPTATQISPAFELVAQAWLDRQVIAYRYAPEGLGEDYFQGFAIVSDNSISTSVDGIGELTVELQGTRELTKIDA